MRQYPWQPPFPFQYTQQQQQQQQANSFSNYPHQHQRQATVPYQAPPAYSPWPQQQPQYPSQPYYQQPAQSVNPWHYAAPPAPPSIWNESTQRPAYSQWPPPRPPHQVIQVQPPSSPSAPTFDQGSSRPPSQRSSVDPYAALSASNSRPPSIQPPSRTPSAGSARSDFLHPLNEDNLDYHTFTMSAATDFSDYDVTVRNVSRLTVDRLKNVLRHMNLRLHHGHRMSGLKAELAGRVRAALEDTKTQQDLVAYNEIRRAVVSPTNISVGSVASDTASQTGASTSTAPQASTSAAPYVPPAAAAPPPPAPAPYTRPTPTAPAAYSIPGRQPQTYGFNHFNNGVPASTAPATSTAPPARHMPFGSQQAWRGANGPVASTSAPTPPPAANAPLINFRTNPFFKVSEAVSSISVCPKAPSGDRKSTVATINLNDHQRQLLLDARNDATKPQYQLRLFCTSENFFSLPVSSYPYNRVATNQPFGPAPVEFPTTSELKLNHTPLNVNLRGIKKKEGSTVPPDLGKTVNGLRALNLDAHATNRVELVYINSDKKYFFIVNLVEYRDTSHQVRELQKGKVKAKDEVAQAIIASNSDEDIVATSSVLNLKCPLTFIRMTNPTRSTKCSHIQCFDAESFFSMMEQTPIFNCPVCNKLLNVEDLIIDGYTQDIIRTVPSSYDTVVVEIDATWRTEDNKCGTNAKVGTIPSRAATEEVKPRPNLSRNGSTNGATNGRPGDSVHILDDSDDDQPQRAPRDSAISSNGGGNGGGATKKAGAVIDLTLSDDEDVPASGSGVPQVAGQKRAGSDYGLAPPPANRPRYDPYGQFGGY